jgi:hypothetical protein
LFSDDDATDDMAALGALAARPTPNYGNVSRYTIVMVEEGFEDFSNDYPDPGALSAGQYWGESMSYAPCWSVRDCSNPASKRDTL